MALVSLSVGAVLLSGMNFRIRAAHQLARRSEQIASENFRLARKAVDDYLTTVSQETLLDEPGMHPLRKKLLKNTLTYYQGFVQQQADDPQFLLELRDANVLVGTISQQIGSHKESLAAFRRALEINLRLVAK